MKKNIILLIVGAVAVLAFFQASVFAGGLEEAKLKLANIKMQSMWLKERQIVLKYMEKDLAAEVKRLAAAAEAQKGKSETGKAFQAE